MGAKRIRNDLIAEDYDGEIRGSNTLNRSQKLNILRKAEVLGYKTRGVASCWLRPVLTSKDSTYNFSDSIYASNSFEAKQLSPTYGPGQNSPKELAALRTTQMLQTLGRTAIYSNSPYVDTAVETLIPGSQGKMASLGLYVLGPEQRSLNGRLPRRGSKAAAMARAKRLVSQGATFHPEVPFADAIRVCNLSQDKTAMPALLHTYVFTRPRLPVAKLEYYADVLAIQLPLIQLQGVALLIQHGFYFTAIKVVYSDYELLRATLEEMRLTISQDMEDANQEVIAHLWNWREADKELFLKQFRQLKIISYYLDMCKQLRPLKAQGLAAIARMEKEMLLKVVADFLNQLEEDARAHEAAHIALLAESSKLTGEKIEYSKMPEEELPPYRPASNYAMQMPSNASPHHSSSSKASYSPVHEQSPVSPAEHATVHVIPTAASGPSTAPAAATSTIMHAQQLDPTASMSRSSRPQSMSVLREEPELEAEAVAAAAAADVTVADAVVVAAPEQSAAEAGQEVQAADLQGAAAAAAVVAEHMDAPGSTSHTEAGSEQPHDSSHDPAMEDTPSDADLEPDAAEETHETFETDLLDAATTQEQQQQQQQKVQSDEGVTPDGLALEPSQPADAAVPLQSPAEQQELPAADPADPTDPSAQVPTSPSADDVQAPASVSATPALSPRPPSLPGTMGAVAQPPVSSPLSKSPRPHSRSQSSVHATPRRSTQEGGVPSRPQSQQLQSRPGSALADDASIQDGIAQMRKQLSDARDQTALAAQQIRSSLSRPVTPILAPASLTSSHSVKELEAALAASQQSAAAAADAERAEIQAEQDKLKIKLVQDMMDEQQRILNEQLKLKLDDMRELQSQRDALRSLHSSRQPSRPSTPNEREVDKQLISIEAQLEVEAQQAQKLAADKELLEAERLRFEAEKQRYEAQAAVERTALNEQITKTMRMFQEQLAQTVKMAAMLQAQRIMTGHVGPNIPPTAPSLVLPNEVDEPPTHEEIVEYARYLGIDEEGDPDLLYIAEWALTAPVPEGWTVHLDAEGHEFFHNNVTNQSTYEHPMDEHYRQYYLKMKQSKQLS